MDGEKIKAVECLHELKNLLASDENLKVPINDEQFLIRFVRAKKYDSALAYKTVRNYYKSKQNCPKISKYLYPSYGPVKYAFENKMFGKLTFAAPGGQPVIHVKNDNWDMEKATLNNIMSALTLTVEEVLLFSEEAQLNGVIVINDLVGLSMAHVRQFTPSTMKAALNLYQGSFPLRLKKMFIVNEPKIFGIIYNLCWPFLTKKLKDRLVFCGRDMTKLHSVLPPEILPVEYGGKLPNNEAYNVGFVEGIFKNDGYYKGLLDYGFIGTEEEIPYK